MIGLPASRDVYGVRFSGNSLANPTVEVTGPTPIASVGNPVRAGITIVTLPADDSLLLIDSLSEVAHTFHFHVTAGAPAETATLHLIDTTINNTVALAAQALAQSILRHLGQFVQLGTRQEAAPNVSGAVTLYVTDKTGGDNATFATKSGGDSATSIIIGMWKAGKERVVRLEGLLVENTTAANKLTITRRATPFTGGTSAAVVPVPHDPTSPAAIFSAKSYSVVAAGGGLIVATYPTINTPALETKYFDFLNTYAQAFFLRTPMESHVFAWSVAEAVEFYAIYSEAE